MKRPTFDNRSYQLGVGPSPLDFCSSSSLLANAVKPKVKQPGVTVDHLRGKNRTTGATTPMLECANARRTWSPPSPTRAHRSHTSFSSSFDTSNNSTKNFEDTQICAQYGLPSIDAEHKNKVRILEKMFVEFEGKQEAEREREEARDYRTKRKLLEGKEELEKDAEHLRYRFRSLMERKKFREEFPKLRRKSTLRDF